MTGKKIIKATVGHKLHTYNTWDGSSTDITVEYSEMLSNSVLFTGTNAWGGKSDIYVDKDYIEQLIKTGEAVKHNEIDHCDVRTMWSLQK